MFSIRSYWYDFIVQSEGCAKKRKTKSVTLRNTISF